ncbi:hypothetical protein ACQR1I_36710 [Bradyrhizobium sp. HKCCYLS2038]|uniref:hypothetical protein n=1 Tax=Bradyrhizobium sp. HKCCYLS2038 TaxID=3420764 RepID=UPI003EBF5F12
MTRIVIFQSKQFAPERVVSTYARLYSNGEVKLFDVDKRHKTLREQWVLSSTLDDETRAKLRLGEQVLISGLTMQQREST